MQSYRPSPITVKGTNCRSVEKKKKTLLHSHRLSFIQIECDILPKRMCVFVHVQSNISLGFFSLIQQESCFFLVPCVYCPYNF